MMLATSLVKIIANTDRAGDCWLWTAGRFASGYAQMRHNGTVSRVHRVSYELAYGPIPAGLVIDHLCRVKNCVRPDHLEAVTQQENLLRGATVNAANAAKSHCIHGHPLTGPNAYVNPTSGHRSCRACQRINSWRRPVAAVAN